MSSRKPPTSRGSTTNSGPGRGSGGRAGGGTGAGRGSLRLTGDGPDQGGATAMLDEIKAGAGGVGGDDAEGGPIPFPLRPDARARLLAGVVRVPARPELGSQQSPVIGRIGHDRLVRSIEAELNRMQAAIDQFDADVDAEIESSLKFPGPGGDDDFRPRAA